MHSICIDKFVSAVMTCTYGLRDMQTWSPSKALGFLYSLLAEGAHIRQATNAQADSTTPDKSLRVWFSWLHLWYHLSELYCKSWKRWVDIYHMSLIKPLQYKLHQNQIIVV